jgi:hypothetical protein
VVWQTPRGELAWVPHPRPAPAASPQSFWGSNFLGPSSANGGRQGLFNNQEEGAVYVTVVSKFEHSRKRRST